MRLSNRTSMAFDTDIFEIKREAPTYIHEELNSRLPQYLGRLSFYRRVILIKVLIDIILIYRDVVVDCVAFLQVLVIL
jgi:hypothetical protein